MISIVFTILNKITQTFESSNITCFLQYAKKKGLRCQSHQSFSLCRRVQLLELKFVQVNSLKVGLFWSVWSRINSCIDIDVFIFVYFFFFSQKLLLSLTRKQGKRLETEFRIVFNPYLNKKINIKKKRQLELIQLVYSVRKLF